MFVHVVPGDSPIVMTVPHDGWIRFADLPAREQVRRWDSLGGSDPRDERTLPIARGCRAVLRRFGVKPTIIWVSAHRAHVDVNRGPKQQPFMPGFHGTYVAFHRELDAALRRATNRYGRAIHVDLHGFETPPGREGCDVVFGTRSGSTSPDGSDLTVTASLASAGYDTVFSPDTALGVTRRYRGGWTVVRIADDWHNEPVDSMQIELHARLRLAPRPSHISRDIASALVGALAN